MTMSRASIKSSFTATRRINFLIGWFSLISQSLSGVMLSLDQLVQAWNSGEDQADGDTQPSPSAEVLSAVELLRSNMSLAEQMLDLREEKYVWQRLPDGAIVCYFSESGLQLSADQARICGIEPPVV